MSKSDNVQELRVAGGSDPSSVGGAIVKNLDEDKDVELIAVGAGAVNQTVKAIAIASGFAAPQGKVLSTRPAFIDVDIEGETKTALKFKIIVD